MSIPVTSKLTETWFPGGTLQNYIRKYNVMYPILRGDQQTQQAWLGSTSAWAIFFVTPDGKFFKKILRSTTNGIDEPVLNTYAEYLVANRSSGSGQPQVAPTQPPPATKAKPGPDPVSSASTTSDTSQLLTPYFNTYNSSFAEGDISAWMELWEDNAELIVKIEPQLIRRGKASIRDAYMESYNYWASLRITEVKRFSQGSSAVWEGIWEAVQRSTGKRVKLPLVEIIEFDQSGKIRRVHRYFDWAIVPRQLQ